MGKWTASPAKTFLTYSLRFAACVPWAGVAIRAHLAIVQLAVHARNLFGEVTRQCVAFVQVDHCFVCSGCGGDVVAIVF